MNKFDLKNSDLFKEILGVAFAELEELLPQKTITMEIKAVYIS